MTSIFTALACMVISHTVESPALHYSTLRVRNFELEGGQIISWHVRVPYNAAIFKVKLWVDIPHALRLFILSPHVVSKDNKIVMLGFLADVFSRPPYPSLAILVYFILPLDIEWGVFRVFSCLSARQWAFLFFLPIGKAVCFYVLPAYRQGSVLLCSSCLSAWQWAFLFFLPIGKAVCFYVLPAYRQGSVVLCSSCLLAWQCAFMFFLPIGMAVGFYVLPAYRQGSGLLCSSCLSAWQWAFLFFLPIGKAVSFSVLPAYRQGSVLLCSSCLSARQCAFMLILPIGKAVCFCVSTAYRHGSVLLHVLSCKQRKEEKYVLWQPQINYVELWELMEFNLQFCICVRVWN